jgi:hypothetical protein
MLTKTAARLMLQEIHKEFPEEIDRLIMLDGNEELDDLYFSNSNGDRETDIITVIQFGLNQLKFPEQRIKKEIK